VQSEEAIDIHNGFLRDVDIGPHRIILPLAMRDNDVEAVGSAALEDHDQALGARCGLSRGAGNAG
jgi:hypothetical protein